MKEAKIINISKNKIVAEINADSMCKTCPTSTSCFIKDCSKKQIEITKPQNKNYKIGDKIFIDINNNSTFFALFFAYILPLIILLSTFYALQYYNFSQTKCGFFSIISLIPYYFLLFLNKDKIAHKIKVEIYDN